ncbi:methyltransferase [Bacteroidia bacterium]|nr:methyltransferase [Bacteroidia bacterium]
MRIVGGKYKSRRFEVPKTFKARPTTDFAKENLFNILSNLIDLEDAVALDLFSGTGSISFELLSRGCQEVISIEQDFAHHAFIKKVQSLLKDEHLKAIKTDAFRFLKTTKQTFDLIFADPPYTLKDLEKIPEIILSKPLLRENGIFIMEHPKEYDFSPLPHFAQKRTYGAVNFSIFLSELSLRA